MDLELSLIIPLEFMKATGKKTRDLALGTKGLVMAMNMKGSTSKERSTGKESTSGLVESAMKASGSKAIKKDMASGKDSNLTLI